jgi:hypothetical protein
MLHSNNNFLFTVKNLLLKTISLLNILFSLSRSVTWSILELYFHSTFPDRHVEVPSEVFNAFLSSMCDHRLGFG